MIIKFLYEPRVDAAGLIKNAVGLHGPTACLRTSSPSLKWGVALWRALKLIHKPQSANEFKFFFINSLYFVSTVTRKTILHRYSMYISGSNATIFSYKW